MRPVISDTMTTCSAMDRPWWKVLHTVTPGASASSATRSPPAPGTCGRRRFVEVVGDERVGDEEVHHRGAVGSKSGWVRR
ncbi:hypothetical protein [Actinophytocola sp. NPDC049390]|uniref:hypothetical protein n=1 Tax=Actinophytocola sp. NPDC049390 TaxID=3363894 RepID=UPI0037A0ECE9